MILTFGRNMIRPDLTFKGGRDWTPGGGREYVRSLEGPGACVAG